MGGLVNKAIFPRPDPTYKPNDYDGIDRLLYVETCNVKNANQNGKIPCVYMPYLDEKDFSSKYVLLLFHANAEDLGLAYDLGYELRNILQINVLISEYNGYGCYEDFGRKCCAEQMLYDSYKVYEFVKEQLGFQDDKIILFGRSIGSGPCCYLTMKTNARGSILFMPIKSIRSMAEKYTNSLLAKKIVDDILNNQLYIQNMKPDKPMLILHGLNDEIVPCEHALDLFQVITEKNFPDTHINKLFISQTMTHNNFSLQTDLMDPIKQFFNDNKIITFNQQNRVHFCEMKLLKVIYQDLLSLHIQKEKEKQILLQLKNAKKKQSSDSIDLSPQLSKPQLKQQIENSLIKQSSEDYDSQIKN